MNEAELLAYEPYNEQEAADQAVMLSVLPSVSDSFSRDNLILHWTASAWITNCTRDKVLMIYHNIYDSWAWTGGHADGQHDLLQVAVKEAIEETGLTSVHPILPSIFSLETLTVNSHVRRGRFVPSHLHLNVTYLLEADENEPLRFKPDENSGAQWFSLPDAVAACSEPWMRPIYQKLNDKLEALCKN